MSNYNVSTFIKEFVVKLPPGETLDFESGGYIQIDVPEIDIDFKTMDITPHPELGHKKDVFQSDWDKFNLWPLKMKNDEPIFRAYSMANHPAEGNIIMLKIRIATPQWDRVNYKWMDINPGICYSYVFSRKPGDKIFISGPYGEFHINETQREMIYIGGGAGMAPLRSHIFHLFHTQKLIEKFHIGTAEDQRKSSFIWIISEKLRRTSKTLISMSVYLNHFLKIIGVSKISLMIVKMDTLDLFTKSFMIII